jgi:hypothetical protein
MPETKRWKWEKKRQWSQPISQRPRRHLAHLHHNSIKKKYLSAGYSVYLILSCLPKKVTIEWYRISGLTGITITHKYIKLVSRGDGKQIL